MQIGKNIIEKENKEVTGKLIEFNGEHYYKISHVDKMRPFFMSIISHSNHWMFISSNGGLTAGRQNSESSLFPYYTDDRITEDADITGSKTILKINKGETTYLWEPFSDSHRFAYQTESHLYKNRLGNKILFEEINHDLNIAYRYEWLSSERYGFIKKSSVENLDKDHVEVELLDGIQNLLPYGVGSDLQSSRSNLVDAYKKNELESPTGLGIYSLSAIIVDKAEPSESFMATTVWSTGIQADKHLICSRQLDAYRNGESIRNEVDVRAERGAYFINSSITLQANEVNTWYIVAEVNQSMVDIAEINSLLGDHSTIVSKIESDVESCGVELLKLAAASDGLQLGQDKLRNMRHFSNTMFNIMRGGIFDDNYHIEKADFANYLKKANKQVFQDCQSEIDGLDTQFELAQLVDIAEQSGNPDFKRLSYEYLPLKFSRRHGDPSRPWNKFSINTADEFGNKVLDYEGNWRDIFQNWEALAYSYPEFVENMIHKFLNATTFDGYNPYRVTKDGFDWEAIEPDDPWSYIGYWGDHQIIYLLKLLEILESHRPGRLLELFDQEIFVFANVPYQIKSYDDIVNDPQDTIDYNHDLDQKIRELRKEIGADGALIRTNDDLYRVNFIEKILVTTLAKVSNYIPEAGIWMNTQRPEWNDANNALVGNGVSMVTLNYLYRFMKFFGQLLEQGKLTELTVSIEIRDLFDKVITALGDSKNSLSRKHTDQERKEIMDTLGMAGSAYRDGIYENGYTGSKSSITTHELLEYVDVVNQHLKHAIEANKREDGMYHSYNLITIKDDAVRVSYLPEMLEGQVAVLSSGAIDLREALNVMDGLKSSKLFRHDQYSYLLYPDKDLPRFVDKNNIPLSMVDGSELLQMLVKEENEQIIEKDLNGNFHYNGKFNNADSLNQALSELDNRYQSLVQSERKQLLADFETLFNHKAFTGRSGTFFGYEGLGSIYWHMVSKLVLAVMENCVEAISTTQDEELIGKLFEHYYEMNEGIGVHKSPELYGAFPTDPYSHTPGNKGAQQPGMTGQVKEDILSRFMELGVFVRQGAVEFNPRMLRDDELLEGVSTFSYFNVSGDHCRLEVPNGSVAFTYCQVPVVYHANGSNKIEITRSNSVNETIEGLNLGKQNSESLFSRKGLIEKIEVHY